MSKFDNSAIFRVIMKRRKHIVIIVLAAAGFGFILSSSAFIKPKYKSTAVVYPVNIIPYSLESPTEQLLQLFHSADVRTLMVSHFNLGKYYGIEPKSLSALTLLNNKYDENVLIRKTEYESIKIDIIDENADTACSMVNHLVECVDIKARMLQREKTMEVVKILGDQLHQKTNQIDSLSEIENLLRIRYGLLDYKSQAKEATKSYLKLVSEGASRDKIRLVDSLMRNLQEKGGLQVSISNQLKGLRDAYNDIKIEYDKAISDMTKELTYSNIVTKPYPSDSKCYPIRSLIVFICAFSSLLLAIFSFIIIDRRSDKSNAGTANQ